MSDKNLLTDAISNIDDRFLDEYFETKRSYARKGKPMKKKYIIILVAVLAFACMAGFTAGPAVVEHIIQAIPSEPKEEVKIDPENYDQITGELKDAYVLDLVNEIFENKSHPYMPAIGYVGMMEEQRIKGKLSKDIRAMDYLARKYPEEFEPRTDLIYNDDELEVKYIAKILSVLESKSALTADQSKYLIGYLEGRKYQVRVAGYEDKYNSVVGGIMIDNAINKMPGMAESYAETVFGTELTAEQKALAEKLEAERLARIEAENEAAAIAWLKHTVMSEVGTSRELGQVDTSRLKTQEEIDMYNQLIASGEIISREQWELSVETDVKQ